MVMGAMAFYASGDIHVAESLLAQQNVQNINTQATVQDYVSHIEKRGKTHCALHAERQY